MFHIYLWTIYQIMLETAVVFNWSWCVSYMVYYLPQSFISKVWYISSRLFCSAAPRNVFVVCRAMTKTLSYNWNTKNWWKNLPVALQHSVAVQLEFHNRAGNWMSCHPARVQGMWCNYSLMVEINWAYFRVIIIKRLFSCVNRTAQYSKPQRAEYLLDFLLLLVILQLGFQKWRNIIIMFGRQVGFVLYTF